MPEAERRVRLPGARVEPGTLDWLRSQDPSGTGSISRALDELHRRAQPLPLDGPVEAAEAILEEIPSPRQGEPPSIQKVRRLADVDAALRRRGKSPTRSFVKATAQAIEDLQRARAPPQRGRRL